MFKVFISASSLENLCLAEMDKERKEQSSWFLILCKQNAIYLDKNIWEEWISNGDNYLEEPLYNFSSSNGVELRTSGINFNEACENKSKLFLDEPQGAFLLDVDESIAQSIQEQYGIICQSTNNLSDCVLDIDEQKFPLFQGKKIHTWDEIFSSIKSIPSNSLIIVDRYIFSYENTYQSTCSDGLKNIKEIIQSALPEKLSCDFHIMIIFDSECVDDNFDLVKYAQTLDFFKQKEFNRPYNIIIELYAITNACYCYNLTHNRRIISNYYIVYADHMFKAFSQTGSPICRQNIRIESAYSYGLHDNNVDSTMYEIQEDLKGLAALHKHALEETAKSSKIAEEYDVIRGANDESDVQDIQNRLLLMK